MIKIHPATYFSRYKQSGTADQPGSVEALFYFYDAFYENVDDEDPIDDSIETSYSLYQYYTRYLFAALERKPSGTRLVTYHGLEEEVPDSYKLADVSYNTLLKMRIKQ